MCCLLLPQTIGCYWLLQLSNPVPIGFHRDQTSFQSSALYLWALGKICFVKMSSSTLCCTVFLSNVFGLFETYGGSYQPSTSLSLNLNVENFLPVLITNHFALPDKIWIYSYQVKFAVVYFTGLVLTGVRRLNGGSDVSQKPFLTCRKMTEVRSWLYK